MAYVALAPEKVTELAAIYANAGSNDKLALAGGPNGLSVVAPTGPASSPSPEFTPV